MSITDEEMQKIVDYNKALEALGPAPDFRSADEVAAATEAAHAANQAETDRNEAANAAGLAAAQTAGT